MVTGKIVSSSNHYYVVKATDALGILETKNPKAVVWWLKESIFYKEGTAEQLFLFNPEACEVVV